MNSLKIGIIGLFILLPFLFISYIQVEQKKSIRKTEMIVEQAAERAMRDGVFALKTYSRFAYDAEKSKKIKIAEVETIDCVNRSFAYALNAKTEHEVMEMCQNLRLIGFVVHDALIIHDQKKGERLEIPFYQMEVEDQAVRIQKQGIDDQKSLMPKHWSIEKTLEKILKPYIGGNTLLLPEQRSTLFGNDYSEVGVFLMIKGDPLQIGEEQNYFKIGKVSLSERKGMEIRKKEEADK